MYKVEYHAGSFYRRKEVITHFGATPAIMVGKDDYWERVFEIPTLTGCNIREVHIQNRFPSHGFALNNKCNIFIRVSKGYELTLFTANGDGISSRKGESFVVPKGTAYYIITNPVAVLLIMSEPPWDKEQAEIVTF